MQTILIVSILISLFCIALVVFLIQKDKRRQEELIQLEKELQVVQLMSQLKEKEINAIRSIIKVQKKERLKTLNDLRQDLDNVLEGIKNSFGALKSENTKSFYHKIDNLIHEAYQIICQGAQHRRAVLDPKQGFIKALKLTAKDISESENMTIKVHDKPINHNLENNLELTLYSIIQELVNNAIQHAKAIEINIHIYTENEQLFIEVEDDGRGFNPSKVSTSNSGIGLKVIHRRIRNLEGKTNIDSRMGVGTKVTIKLPLKNKRSQSA